MATGILWKKSHDHYFLIAKQLAGYVTGLLKQVKLTSRQS